MPVCVVCVWAPGLLHCRFASLLKRELKDINAADQLYRRAVQSMPRHGEFKLSGDCLLFARVLSHPSRSCVTWPAAVLGNYATFCHRFLNNTRKVR